LIAMKASPRITAAAQAESVSRAVNNYLMRKRLRLYNVFSEPLAERYFGDVACAKIGKRLSPCLPFRAEREFYSRNGQCFHCAVSWLITCLRA
jgi:hypothetical protein